MTFASPAIALAGIAAIALPLALHFFFRRRQKPIPWAAMELLRQAIRRTTRRRYIERVTLLIIRCLAVIMTGAAIAGPLIRGSTDTPTTGASSKREVVLVIDDGLSQHTITGSTTAFETNRNNALSVIDDLQSGDRIALILAAGGRPLVWPPSEDLASARAALVATPVSYEPTDFDGAINAIKGTSHTIGVLSSFRRGSLTVGFDSTTQPETAKVVITQPGESEIANTQVVSFDPQARGPLSTRNGIPIQVRLVREGGALVAGQSLVSVESDDGAQTTLRIVWREGQTEAVASGFITTATHRQTDLPLRATLTPPDAQPADDTRFTVVGATSSIRVGIVDRASDAHIGVDGGVRAWIERALRPTDDVDIETEVIEPTALNQQRCQGMDAMIVIRPDAIDGAGWAVLSRRVRDGMVVLIVPPPHRASGTWSEGLLNTFSLGWTIAMESRTSDTGVSLQSGSTQHPLLAQVSAELNELIQPITIHRWFSITAPTHRGETILALQDGTPFIIRGTVDGSRGSIILFAAPPDMEWTNLPAKPLMVPLFQEIVRQAIVQVDQGRQLRVGEDRLQSVVSGTNALRLVMGCHNTTAGEARILSVDPQGILAQAVTTPGVYTAVDANDRSTGWVIVNIDTKAASTQPSTTEAIIEHWKGATLLRGDMNTTQQLAASSQGTAAREELPIARALRGESMAVWFFCTLLLLLLVETWVATQASATRQASTTRQASLMTERFR